MRRSSSSVEDQSPDLLEEALRYRERMGWALLPMGPNKKPLTVLLPDGHWAPLRTSPPTTDDIRAWFSSPYADQLQGIGLICGDPSGTVVMDWDCPPDEVGYKTGPTPMTLTPRPGLHVLMKCPRGLESGHAFGAEVRANKLYTILPPSRHPNGGFYGWAPYLSPWDVDLLPLPTEVVEAVQRPRVPPPKGGAAGRGVKAPEAVGTSNPIKLLVPTAAAVASPGGLDADGVMALVTAPGVAEAQMAHMAGHAVSEGRGFCCLLHKDTHPSAALWIAPDGVPYYHDFHAAVKGTDREFLLLPRLYALLHGRDERGEKDDGRLSNAELVTWQLRLLVDAGVVAPAFVPMGVLPVGVPRTVRQVYEGFRLLLGCRWLYTQGDPAPLAWRFAAAWCGVSKNSVGPAMGWLMRHDYVRRVGECTGQPIPGLDRKARMNLFLPGPGDGRPYIVGELT